jgi:hypothetical protein
MDTGRITYVAQIQSGAYGLYDRPGCSVSGCGSLESFLASDPERIAVGAYVVDGTALDFDVCAREAISGPMVDGSLADGTVDAFAFPTDGELPAGITAGIVDAFGMSGLAVRQAATADTAERGPFDSISPAEGAARWAKLGARVGRWDGREVQWIAGGERA